MEVFNVYSSFNKHFRCIVCKGNKCYGVDEDGTSEFSTVENVINRLLEGGGWYKTKTATRWDEDIGPSMYSFTKQSHPEYFI